MKHCGVTTKLGVVPPRRWGLQLTGEASGVRAQLGRRGSGMA
jgi:hypothetical protein